MAFPNESKKLSNVDANVSVLKILVAPTRNQVNQVLVTHDQKMAFIMAQLNQLKNEKVELSTSIKVQYAKVQMCKEKLHDVLGGASGMREAFQTIKTTLTNVKGVT